MTIGDWQRALEGTAENPAMVPDEADIGDSIEVDCRDGGYLYKDGDTAIKEEDENDITTDLSDESDEYIDYDSQSDFDEDADGDEDEEDENME
jgi:hypothetical protein